MGAFAIMRMEKLKSGMAVKRALDHNTRERMPSNADPLRSSLNKYEGGSVDHIIAKYNERLPDKIRKNAVLAVELVMTASPDAKLLDWGDYLKDCTAWAKKLFGADNVLSVAQHLDEKTPHVQIIAMPLIGGKLNARHFIGGSRDRMAELQDEFYKEVGFLHGLSRGQSKEETRTRHTHHRLADLDAREKKLIEAEKNNHAQAEHLALRFEENVKLKAELTEKISKVSQAEKLIKGAIGLTPAEINAMKTDLATWDRMSPQELRGFATVMESKKCGTVLEYRKKAEEAKIKAQNQQGYKTSR